MTSEEFQQTAVSLTGVRYETKLGSLSFSVSGKTFATLGSPDPTFALIKLTPEEQAKAMIANPLAFCPQAGGAGARGWTCVRLTAIEAGALLPYLKSAKALAGNAKSVRTVLR